MTEPAFAPSANVGGIGDLDGDGYKEVVVCASKGVFIFNHDGTSMLSINPILRAGAEYFFPCIGDINGDNLMEVVASAGKNSYAWDFPGNIADSDWPLYAHDIANTSCYGQPVAKSDAVISLDREVYAPLFFEVFISLMDSDLNIDSTEIDQAWVEIHSDTEIVPEIVVLTETAEDTGMFEGYIPLSLAQPADNGTLQVSHGDTIRVSYHETDPAGVKKASAVIDTAGPEILAGSVKAEMEFDAGIQRIFADISWLTGEPGDSKVFYGIGELTDTIYAGSFVTEHHIRIGGRPPLQLNQVYYFAVQSKDPYGNTTYDDNSGNFYQFTTSVPEGMTSLTVLDSGQPVKEIDIFVCDPDGNILPEYQGGRGGPSSRTNKDGQALFNLPEGEQFMFKICESRGRERIYHFTGVFTAPANIIFDISEPDTTPPTVVITSPIDGGIYGASLMIEGTASDDVSTITSVSIIVDNGNPVKVDVIDGDFSYQLAGLAEGSHVITVKACDEAGYKGFASVIVTIDLTKPIITVDSPTGTVYESSPEMKGHVSERLKDDRITIACIDSPDPDAFVEQVRVNEDLTWILPAGRLNLKGGDNHFILTGFDLAGNPSEYCPVTITYIKIVKGTIYSIWPMADQPGKYVRIYGRDFGPWIDSSRVEFSDPGKSSQIHMDAQIIRWYERYILCKVPQFKPGIYKVTAINLAGESNFKSFRVRPKPSPYIRWLWPYRGREGQQIRIYGRNFGEKDKYSRVFIYGNGSYKYAQIVSWNNSRIVFKVPGLRRKGWHRVKLRTKDGWSNSRHFYYY